MQSYSYKDIWRVSIPIMLGLLAQNVVQLTDTFFLGYVGGIEQSASGLAGIYYVAIFTICFGFSIGGQIIISRRNGEQNYDKIGSIVIQGAIFLQMFALILFFLSQFLLENVLANFLKSPEVYAATEQYLSWRIYGFFFAVINVMFRAFYVGIARTKVLTYNAIAMAVANIIGDYVLIFGKFGFPEMGIEGAAIASVLSEIVSVLFFFIYTFITVDFKKYGFVKMKFRMSIIKSILNISSFTMVQYLISMSTWFIFFVAIEQHSEDALKITNLVRSFYMVFFIPMNALATTANTLVGNTIGMGNQKGVLPLIKKICLLNLGIIIFMIAFTLIAPEFWISFIAPKDQASLIGQTVTPLIVLMFSLPISAIGTVVFNSISGTGNTKIALILECITMVIYVGAMFWIVIYKQMSVAACWAVEYFYWVPLAIFSIIYLTKAKWQNKSV
ncbi:putative MATE family efflux protein [Dysgonomonas hofstadii]|uniref:Multidrug-efflux transporter n=1 Tax=Dysgonomonas hofstadii TaxID=637886 RepID=A0A840CH66_9BACT|nr:MATE family efflux transporter [Dysgonomonas hofstadii]MBB4034606.1 putative MATE family efflux protein [Dysgonomonas hofstadii]